MMKKLNCLILTVLLMLLAGMAMAESGEFGGGTWTLDEQGVLTFTGSADLSEWRTNGTEFQMKVTKVVYGPDITGVCPGSYAYAYNLTEFEVDPENTVCRSVDGMLYSKDMTELIEAPTGMTGSYTIPEGVTVIRDSAFIGSALSELILPESLLQIEAQAFWNAEFTSLHIPANTSDIAASALNLTQVETFSVAEGNPSFSAADGVLFNRDGTALIHYPAGNAAEEYTVPSGVETIGYNSFAFAGNLKKLTIPESVTSLGNNVFMGCYALSEITYGGTVAEWEALREGTGNDRLDEIRIICTDGPVDGQGGESSEPELRVSLVTPCYFAEGLGLEEIRNGLFMQPEVANCSVYDENADIEQDPEGPQWILEQLEGTAVVEIHKSEVGDPSFCKIMLTVPPEQSETDRWRVTCIWNGEPLEEEMTIEFRELSTFFFY